MADQRSTEAQAYRGWYKTRAWRLIRRQQLNTEPLCRMCDGERRTTVATVCDHIERHQGDRVKFFSGPFQSLCKPCHDRAKQSEERRGYSSQVGPDGWPVDARHPANSGGRGGSNL
jgi:hypothetical protein